MHYVMSPERRQELAAALEQYVHRRFKGKSFFDRIPCAHAGESGAEVYKKKQTRVEQSETYQSDDDWDILERIYSRPQRGPDDGDIGAPLASKPTVHDMIEESEQQETFTEALLRLIAEKELTEPEVYNSVFMDRKLFNKIRNTPEYQPSKRTALLLAVALKLNMEETNRFIGKAGFQLSDWNKFDVIVEYFIENGNYNILEINEMLAYYKMPLLLRCD